MTIRRVRFRGTETPISGPAPAGKENQEACSVAVGSNATSLFSPRFFLRVDLKCGFASGVSSLLPVYCVDRDVVHFCRRKGSRRQLGSEGDCEREQRGT